MRKSTNGFTLVELLIVIVVIAILAAISVVAFNGIQTRAENTKTNNSIAAYVRVLKAYAVERDELPIASFRCLGPVDTICGNVTSTAAACVGVGRASYNIDFADAIKEVSPTIPYPSTQKISCGGVDYVGAFYHSTTGETAAIHYFLRGDQDCDNVGATLVTRLHQDDLTRCSVRIET